MPPRKRMEKKDRKKKLPKRTKTDQEILDVFQLFDRDGNGTIDTSELREVMFILGQATTEEELQAMMDKVDTNKNGVLDFEEFRSLMTECVKDDDDAQLEITEAFSIFDKNNDGGVTKDELGYVLRKCGKFKQKELDEMFALIDINHDGKIDYEEFSRAMCKRIL